MVFVQRKYGERNIYCNYNKTSKVKRPTVKLHDICTKEKKIHENLNGIIKKRIGKFKCFLIFDQDSFYCYKNEHVFRKHTKKYE